MDAATMEKIMAVLNPEQQSKWKEMLGEPFKGKVDRPGAGVVRFGRRGSDDKPSGKDEQ